MSCSGSDFCGSLLYMELAEWEQQQASSSLRGVTCQGWPDRRQLRGANHKVSNGIVNLVADKKRRKFRDGIHSKPNTADPSLIWLKHSHQILARNSVPSHRDAHGNNFSRGTPKMCMFMSKFKSLIYLAWAVLNLTGGRHFLNQKIYGTHKAHLWSNFCYQWFSVCCLFFNPLFGIFAIYYSCTARKARARDDTRDHLIRGRYR